jgi:hypothetical protein
MADNLTPDEVRQRLRVDYAVWVRVECEYCGREFAELYGLSADQPTGLFWSEEGCRDASGGRHPRGRGARRDLAV